MAYKFSLQNVLEWREDQESEAKVAVNKAKETHQKEEKYLNDLIKEHVKLKEKSALSTKVSVMRQDDLYKKVLSEKIVQQKLIVEQTENDVKRAEEALVEAHKERKVMEKLKEKELQKHIDEENAIEQKNLDEFATITYGRQAF